MPRTTTATPPAAVSTSERVLAALAAGSENTAAQIADTAGIGRSTATKTLAALSAAGRVVRTPGGRDGARRLPDHWALPARTRRRSAPPAGTPIDTTNTERLGRGQLTAQVLDYLRAHAGEHAPAAVAKALGGRSSGAVSNALDALTGRDLAVQTSAKPRRYHAATTA